MPRRSEFKLTKRAVDALAVKEKDAVFWECARRTGAVQPVEVRREGEG